MITGEDGAAEEDLACAEYIAALVQHGGLNSEASGVSIDPASYLQRVTGSNTAQILAQRVASHTPGVHPRDIEAAMEVNRFDFVMMAHEEQLSGFGPVLVLRAYNRGDD